MNVNIVNVINKTEKHWDLFILVFCINFLILTFIKEVIV